MRLRWWRRPPPVVRSQLPEPAHAYESFLLTTLDELNAEQGIWEPYTDVPNYFGDIPEDERVAVTERLLRELHEEGWATFARRAWGDITSPGTPLDEAGIAAVIASDVWRTWPLRDDANVWLLPTAKNLAWRFDEPG